MKTIMCFAAALGLALFPVAVSARVVRVKIYKGSCLETGFPCPPPPSPPPPQCSGDGPNCQPPPPADCTGPNGVGDCTPPSEDDDAWIEEAIADGCEPIVEVDGEMEVECG